MNQLSLWVRPYVNVFSSFADAQNKVKTFFSSIDEKTFATSNVQSVPGSAGVTGHYQLLKESSFSALVDPPKPGIIVKRRLLECLSN